MTPQRGSKERTATVFRVRKVQEDRERTASLAYEKGNSKILNLPVTLDKKSVTQTASSSPPNIRPQRRLHGLPIPLSATYLIEILHDYVQKTVIIM
jgi:hypothetical protein